MTPADDDAIIDGVADGAAVDAGLDAPIEPDEPAEPAAAGATMAAEPKRSSLGLSLAIAAAVLILDQWSKDWALGSLSDGRSRHVFWFIDWNLTFNSGMAFSRAQGIGPYIGVIALVVIVVMLLSLRRTGGALSAVAVGLVVGGALGNITDRLFRGRGWLHGSVVDFIDPGFWPIFNVADMGVTIGGVLLVITAMLQPRAAAR